MSRRGVLIVLEGVDGSGKATQAKLLLRHLRAAGYKAHVLDFPRYGSGFFAKAIARYLKGELGRAGKGDPYLVSLLYAGDRWQARDQLMRWLRAGHVVVCNRYVSANKGHQGGKITNAAERRRFFRWIDELEHDVYQLPRADMTILLDMPVETAARLVSRKDRRAYVGGRKRDIHEADHVHQQRAAATYRYLARTEKGWCRINCAVRGTLLSPQVIAKKVWRKVRQILPR